MTPILDVAIRSSVLLLIGLAVDAGLRHRPAALRHCVLAASILAAALVVPLGRVMPAWAVAAIETVPGAPVATVSAPNVDPGLPPAIDRQPSAGMDAASLVFAIWAAGFSAAVALLAWRVVRVARVSVRGERIVDRRWLAIVDQVASQYGLARPIAIVRTNQADLIATWGFFRPRVLVPGDAAGWHDDRIHTVLCHELAHVRRGDWLVQIGAEIVRAAYWFNPLAALVCRQLRRQSEHACDDEVLAAGVRGSDYAAHLLELANAGRSPRSWAAALPMARRSTLERRIAAMLNAGSNHQAPSPRALAVTMALLVSAALPVAALRAAQDGPRPLTGSIYDASGAVVPGVTVTLQDAQDFKWDDTTDAAGRFEFPPVQPGKYVLEATLPGFHRMRHEFVLKSARDWDRAVTMPIGELTETVRVSASRQTTPSAQSRPRPVRVGGNIKAPQKILNVNPVYPASMREAGLSGVVPLEAIISVDGSVLSARVRGAQAHPDFAAAALEAVRQWRFTPTLLNGVPVEVVMNVSVTFELAD